MCLVKLGQVVLMLNPLVLSYENLLVSPPQLLQGCSPRQWHLASLALAPGVVCRHP